MFFVELQDTQSVAADAHKWIYAPLEAGRVLFCKREKLLGTSANLILRVGKELVQGSDVRRFGRTSSPNSRLLITDQCAQRARLRRVD
jgi:glutamate/tyrosine decarboxylase-like PLP-dependent enzyme